MRQTVRQSWAFKREPFDAREQHSRLEPASDRNRKAVGATALQDMTVAQRAERALQQKDFRFSRCVRCTCDHGVLVLDGRVPTYYLKQLAQTAVAVVDGVEQVENHLEVFLPDTTPHGHR